MNFLKYLGFGSAELEQHRKEVMRLINALDIQGLVKLVEQTKIDLNYSEDYGQKNTPLLLAINAANIQEKRTIEGSVKISYAMVEFLIERGANVNGADGAGKSPLLAACHWNQPLLVDLLLDRGADMNKATERSPFLNPLYTCLFKKFFELAKVLYLKGADVREVVRLNELNLKENLGFQLEGDSEEWLRRIVNKKKGAQLFASARQQGRQLLPPALEQQFLEAYL